MIYSHKNDNWTPSDIKCQNRGLSKTICKIKCHSQNRCEVKTAVERCTCMGNNLFLEDIAFYNTQTGERLSKPGFEPLEKVRQL